MEFAVFTEKVNPKYKTAILTNYINVGFMKEVYIDPFPIKKEDVIVIRAYVDSNGKSKSAERKEFLSKELYPELEALEVEFLLVTNGDYFKTITGAKKAEANLSLVMEAKDHPNIKVIYLPNYIAVKYDPIKTTSKIALAMEAYTRSALGMTTQIGDGRLVSSFSALSKDEFNEAISRVVKYDTKPVAIDIEAFGLKHYDCGLGSISFSTDKHSAVSMSIDHTMVGDVPTRILDKEKRERLKELFIHYYNTATPVIFHNASYDITVLIYQLFMKHIKDTEGLLYGLEIMTKYLHCTKIISYLALNSTAGNELGLKEQAIEYLGVWAIDEVKDILKVPTNKLLEYNMYDTIGTMYVFEKNYKKMIEEDQLDVYENIFLPSLKDIIQMQLTGLPVDMNQVHKSKEELEDIIKVCRNVIKHSLYVQNMELKEDITFNPNSNPQMGRLLYDYMELPILETTKAGNPATGGDVLEELINHTNDDNKKKVLNALIDYGTANKIYTSFIPALEKSQPDNNGHHWLFGFFNLGGTVTGRMSSNDPNLQNLPSGGNTTKVGKRSAELIKLCFKPPKGYLMVGIDFSSLEDRISALTTKDPNKLKVYLGHVVFKVIDGSGKEYLVRDDSTINGSKIIDMYELDNAIEYPYKEEYDLIEREDLTIKDIKSIEPIGNTSSYDGHSVRAFAYYNLHEKGFNTSLKSVNSIQHKAKQERQEGKSPTFAMTYGGTTFVLKKKFGFDEETSDQIYNAFHTEYKESDKWVFNNIQEATKTGYVIGAFGLKLRTPLLYGQELTFGQDMPYSLGNEVRTAGNMLGQSWCLLNNRALTEVMSQVRYNKELCYKVMPMAAIHDENIYLIKDDLNLLIEFNNIVVKAARWQEPDLIYHPRVHLGGVLGIYHPTWANEIEVPNDITKEQFIELLKGG